MGRAEKQKKLKEKRKVVKAEELKKAGKDPKQLFQPQGKGRGKGGKNRGKALWQIQNQRLDQKNKSKPVDDEVEVEWEVPAPLEGTEMESAMGFAAVRDRFKHVEP